MKKGQTGEGMIEKVDFPNKGILYTEDGEKAIVKNGIPGQKVRFLIQKKRKGKCEARLLEVLEKSPLELADVPCVHFGNCGGCVYQNMRYEEQLKLKERQVIELLSAVVKEDWQFEGIKPSPKREGYRNKMEFSFGDAYKDGPLALGMHKRGSFYDIVTVDQCRIVDDDYNQILRTVLEYFSKEGSSYFKKNSHEGYLRHLLVRRAEKTGELLIVLVTTTQDCGCVEEKLLAGFSDVLLRLKLRGNIAGILHTKNDSIADVVKDEGTRVLYGRDYFYEELLGLRFRISAFSFFQTNSLGAEVLYETVREYIQTNSKNCQITPTYERHGSDSLKNDSVREHIGCFGQAHGGIIYDLYSGTGTIAQILAPKAEKVIGVEIVGEAVRAARENARLNGLSNCAFLEGDVLGTLDAIEEKPDFIILDPPREGVHPKALGKILDYGVERMVYISCKPTSLVRDLELMQERGYRVERACCVDMFPGTVHIEVAVLLTRTDG